MIKALTTFWKNERYGSKTKSKGTIISVHHSGKGGRIKDSNGIIIGFMKKDFVKKIKSIENLKGAIVEFFSMKNFEGKDIAESIEILNFPTQTNSKKGNSQTGQNIEGERVKILHDNERGKAGFIKSNGKEYYFSANQNFQYISQIIVGAKVIFNILPPINDKKEQIRIKKIID